MPLHPKTVPQGEQIPVHFLPLTVLLHIVQCGNTVNIANLQALLVGIEQGQLQWKALPLILQRAVMVAMKASSQEGLSPAASPLQAYHSQDGQQRISHSAAGVTNTLCCYAVGIAKGSVVYLQNLRCSSCC